MIFFLRKKVLLLLFCNVSLYFPLNAEPQKILIRLESYEGKVTVYQNSQVLEVADLEKNINLGLLDGIETGSEGQAVLSLFSPVSIETKMTIGENSSFYFNYASDKGGQKAEIFFLNGSFSLQTKKMTGLGDIVVYTDASVLTVKSTNCFFFTGLQGSILITAGEGMVICKNKTGETVTAQPGVNVEQLQSTRFREIPVEIGNVQSFHEAWKTQKIENFKPSALQTTKAQAVSYIEALDKFNSAYMELMRHRDIFKRWSSLNVNYTANEQKTVEGFVVSDKITVSPAVFKMKNILFFFERSFARVLNLRELYYTQNLEKGMIWPGYDTDAFFIEVSRQKNDLSWKIAQVRYMLKLYSMVSWSFPPAGGINP